MLSKGKFHLQECALSGFARCALHWTRAHKDRVQAPLPRPLRRTDCMYGRKMIPTSPACCVKRLLLVVLFCCALPTGFSAPPLPCRFAPLFTAHDLLFNKTAVDLFLDAVMYWEGQFHQPMIGYNNYTGMTYDGTAINYTTGEPTSPLHTFSAASKESIHLGLLALALAKQPLAERFISPENPANAKAVALDILEKKITSMENFNTSFPGFGGYLPWFSNNDSGIYPNWDWLDRVPALDNGEMIWSIYAVIEKLEDIGEWSLAKRYKTYWDLLVENALTIFWEGDGNIRTVVSINNTKAMPFRDNYQQTQPCFPGCWLDDPYEGELFAMFLYLYTDLNDTEKEMIWIQKRAKLQAVNYPTPHGNITVQRGWWFSAHEQWKYLELPYLEVDINRRVFLNGERARTWNSYLNQLPGMFASVTLPAVGNTSPGYLSAAGIQEIAFQPIQESDVITPYSTVPLFLADRAKALVWYHQMLLGPAMQGPHGSTESINITGSAIAPVLTWDSKITTVCAMLGGFSHITFARLIKEGKYLAFHKIITVEWERVFPSLEGEHLEPALPSAALPMNRPDFPNCTSSSRVARS